MACCHTVTGNRSDSFGDMLRSLMIGNAFSDKIENLCKARALKLFKLSPLKWAVNVQALSGSPANLAVYLALVPLSGTIMGMSLTDGGHLTHGHKVSATGKFWRPVQYGISPLQTPCV